MTQPLSKQTACSQILLRSELTHHARRKQMFKKKQLLTRCESVLCSVRVLSVAVCRGFFFAKNYTLRAATQ